MKKIIVTSLFLLIYSSLSAQKGLIGIGTNSPNAVLDVVSGKNGVLIPRGTATQIQNIQNPDDSELVYSLTNDGVTINRKGFWYYQSGSWKPLLENIINSNNIVYTVDGVLTSERQMTMDGKSLNIGPNLFYISGTSSMIGILTAAPTQTLDVNGEVRVQTLNNAGNVLSDAQGVLVLDTEYFDVGDVKPSFMTTDHDGWYLLNGRDITTLPAAAQNNATSVLGITTTLPDAAGRYSMGTASTPGSFTGNNTVTLVRANLPLFNFTYTTNSTGAHTHTMTFDRIRTNAQNGGGNNVHDYWLSGSFVGGSNYSKSTSFTAHLHTYSVPSGGSNTPVNITPTALNANYFVYLGQ
ncbi:MULTISPECIES: hypothetical protein [Chryseobacterium]|uniref:Microcystin-dependent protein n=1 Tax=Chryseobacterium geocarposphaerae TaxID=1416776 RepID=A0ABU1LHC8_9FLAO|nr:MULTISPECIES: hypothetical protein [Chryseobacterium]MDR6406099.1 microcystin-dependent protein [Chryseobacterium geocarposphaerae]MDR6699427.1 microcystin-dependent protein [Chryseobacterium ginsenosidimutans]